MHLRRLGAAMALLHHQADGWTPPPEFVRIRWDHETFFGDVMVYGGISAAGCWALLPAEVRARFEAVAERMADIMARVGDVGLIHADLHLGNAVFHRGGVKLIDFDDCGTGPRLYDLAVALWELRDDPDYPAFRDALLAGYRAHREIDVTHLDDFIAVRQVAFDLWYTGIAQVNPAFAARLDVVHRWSLPMLDEVEHHRAKPDQVVGQGNGAIDVRRDQPDDEPLPPSRGNTTSNVWTIRAPVPTGSRAMVHSVPSTNLQVGMVRQVMTCGGSTLSTSHVRLHRHGPLWLRPRNRAPVPPTWSHRARPPGDTHGSTPPCAWDPRPHATRTRPEPSRSPRPDRNERRGAS